MFLSLSSFTFFVISTLIFAVAAIPQKPHKVRHKHNLLNFRDNHVNDIRIAFNEFQNIIPHLKTSKTPLTTEWSDIDDLSDEYFDSHDNNLDVKSNRFQTSTESTKFIKKFHHPFSYEFMKKNYQNAALKSEIHARNKRIIDTTKTSTTTPTTTQRTTPRNFHNDDEEYDYDGDISNRRLADDAHATAGRFNHESSNDLQQNEPMKGESLTDYKLKTLATRGDVENSFKHYMENSKLTGKAELVQQHIRRFRIDSKCQWPSKKLIDAPMHPSKLYTPRKYVLHQCSDDTACCSSSDETCVAKKSVEVDFWFQVRQIGSAEIKFDMIRAKNHTECHCVKKDRNKITHLQFTEIERITNINKPRSCKCPRDFIAEIDSEGLCNCNCNQQIVNCYLRYEGKEGFNMSDRRCIQDKSCETPHCLHGKYSAKSGRCPDKDEKFNKGFPV